jgi:streptogrisin D
MKRRIASCAVAIGAAAALSAVVPSAHATVPPSVKPAASTDLATLATTLEKQLGDRSAGSYLDKVTGRLTVTVTDDSAARSVRAAGAIPRTVTRSRADLRKATEELDRSARIPGTAWAVDPTTDQVVISVDQSVKGTALAKIRSVADKLGAAARFKYVSGALRLQSSPLMLDGTGIYSQADQCSLGFNVLGDESVPLHYFLTAGHCTHAGSTWFADPNRTDLLGTKTGVEAFGLNGDYGLVKYQGAGIRAFGTVAGTDQFISGFGDPLEGQSVQRSGSASGVHSGQVTALNATVTAFDPSTGRNVTVGGLIETTVCTEPGDSGGPLFSGGTGLGLTSIGLDTCSNDGTSWYQPVAPIMRQFGLRMWPHAQNPTVPDVRGLPSSTATDLLQQTGFAVQVDLFVDDACIFIGRVQSQSPATGTAPFGSKVAIRVGIRPDHRCP